MNADRDDDGPVLFDVGVVALAHAGTPMSDSAIEYIRDAVHGDLNAVVPYTVVFGAHHVLCAFYDFSRDEASFVLTNFLTAGRVHWYAGPNGSGTHHGLDLAGEHNIDGWDGYYAHVARETGATTVVGLDDDFERIEDITVEIPLTENEREQLHEYLA